MLIGWLLSCCSPVQSTKHARQNMRRSMPSGKCKAHDSGSCDCCIPASRAALVRSASLSGSASASSAAAAASAVASASASSESDDNMLAAAGGWLLRLTAADAAATAAATGELVAACWLSTGGCSSVRMVSSSRSGTRSASACACRHENKSLSPCGPMTASCGAHNGSDPLDSQCGQPWGQTFPQEPAAPCSFCTADRPPSRSSRTSDISSASPAVKYQLSRSVAA